MGKMGGCIINYLGKVDYSYSNTGDERDGLHSADTDGGGVPLTQEHAYKPA